MPATNYFKFFNKTYYNGVPITDLSNRFKVIKNQNLLKSKVFLSYIVSDGEMPEHISEKYYGSTTFFWIVMMINNISNIYEDWHKPIDVFNKYIISKYNSLESAQTEIHHFEDDYGNIISQNDWDGDVNKKYTFYDYEYDINEEKKEIYLIDKQYLPQITREFKNIFS